MDNVLEGRNHIRAYQRKRDRDPTLTLYWLAADEHDNKVELNSLSCLWCKTTLLDEMKGTISTIINAPIGLDDFALAGTIRCKFCKQNYRLAVPKAELIRAGNVL